MEKVVEILTVIEVRGKDKPHSKRQYLFENNKGEKFRWVTTTSSRYLVGHQFKASYQINKESYNERIGSYAVHNLKCIEGINF